MAKKLVMGCLVVVLLAGLGVVGVWVWLESLLTNPVDAALAHEVTFTVPKGATGRSLGPPLIEAGVVPSPISWRYFLWKRGALNAKAGKHVVSTRMSLTQLAEALEAPPLVEDEPFAVVEGWRLRDTDKALTEKGWAKAGEYLKAAQSHRSSRRRFRSRRRRLKATCTPRRTASRGQLHRRRVDSEAARHLRGALLHRAQG